MTKKEIEQLITDAKHQQKGFCRVAGKMSQQLIEALEQVKNIAYEPVLGVVISDDEIETMAYCATNYLAGDCTRRDAKDKAFIVGKRVRDKLNPNNA